MERIYYTINEKADEYSYYQIKKLFPQASFPKESLLDNAKLKSLGITKHQETIEKKETTLDELKKIKLEQVDQWTSNKITGGFTSECSGELVTYDSDIETQTTIQGDALNVHTELFAQKFPYGYPIRGYPQGKNTKIIYHLTPDQVLRWCADLSLHRGACKQEGWTKQTEIMAAESKDELNAIVLE